MLFRRGSGGTERLRKARGHTERLRKARGHTASEWWAGICSQRSCLQRLCSQDVDYWDALSSCTEKTQEPFHSVTFVGSISWHSDTWPPKRQNGNSSPRCFLLSRLHPPLCDLPLSAPGSEQANPGPQSLRGGAAASSGGPGLHLQVRMSRICSFMTRMVFTTRMVCAPVHAARWLHLRRENAGL